MQWNDSNNAGFSPEGVNPWLPVNPNYLQGFNVANQKDNPDALLNFYKRMLHLRKQTPALVRGGYTAIHETAQDYYAFLREDQESSQTCLVVLNLSERSSELKIEEKGPAARCLFSTHKSENEIVPLDTIQLAPFEIFIGELTSC